MPSLRFLLDAYVRTGDAPLLDHVKLTAERMARGGIYDQLEGGFARYSVDAAWTVPHFEKMLYDNAELLWLYARLSGEGELFARVADETAAFLLERFSTPEGAFAAAFDADTEGVEGLTYVWTAAELEAVLGEDAAFAMGAFGVEPGPELRARRERPGAAGGPGGRGAVRGGAAPAARGPAGAPAAGARRQGRGGVERHGRRGARGVLLAHGPPRLAGGGGAGRGVPRGAAPRRGRAARAGLAGGEVSEAPGILEDYAAVALGFLRLGGEWTARALALLEQVRAHFGDGLGGFYDTASDAEALVTRPADVHDGPTASGWALAAAALLEAYAATGDASYKDDAWRAVARAEPVMSGNPRFTAGLHAAAEALVRVQRADGES
nr:hypothetical protein GCM10025732_00360 [Glycomyces mayteni]